MLDTDGYLRLAASNFKRAESYLEDTENQLLKLLDRLEKCSRRVGNTLEEKNLLWEQIDTLIGDSQPLSS